MKTITALKSVTWNVDDLKNHLAILNEINVSEVTDDEAIALAESDSYDVNWNADVKPAWVYE